MSLSGKIEELQRELLRPSYGADGFYGVSVESQEFAKRLTPLLDLAKEMERVIDGLREVSKGLRKFADEYSAAAKGASE